MSVAAIGRRLAAARYHAALAAALPLAGTRSGVPSADGPTAAELALEAEYGGQIAPALSELYAHPIAANLPAMMDMTERQIVRSVLDWYEAEPEPVERLAGVYRTFGRRTFNLGGQMGLNTLGLLAAFSATDGMVLDAIDAQTAELTDLSPRAPLSTAVTTAEEIGREVARRRDEGIEAVDLLPLLSAWVLGRTVVRSALIAATEGVRMTRWGMVWAFAGNGIRGVRHVGGADGDARCSGRLCPPLCGVEHSLGGVFNPMSGIPSGANIPVHGRCRCWWEPLTDGWLKPALIWTGFALDLLVNNE